MPLNVISEDDFRPRELGEAERLFKRKAPLTHDEFERLSRTQKAKAFRVATVHNARMVQVVRNKLATAIRQGVGWADFRREIMAEFTRAQIPGPAVHRLRLAFFQNTMKAYSDERRAVLDDPEIHEAFPFRQYLTVGDGTPGFRNVRPEHAALHGKMFRWNDPFWDVFTPPWDYGCRCTFVALTRGQAASVGVLWTYAGGAVMPVVDAGTTEAGGERREARAFALQPNPRYSIESGELDLRGLDADLRAAVAARMANGE